MRAPDIPALDMPDLVPASSAPMELRLELGAIVGLNDVDGETSRRRRTSSTKRIAARCVARVEHFAATRIRVESVLSRGGIVVEPSASRPGRSARGTSRRAGADGQAGAFRTAASACRVVDAFDWPGVGSCCVAPGCDALTTPRARADETASGSPRSVQARNGTTGGDRESCSRPPGAWPAGIGAASGRDHRVRRLHTPRAAFSTCRTSSAKSRNVGRCRPPSSPPQAPARSSIATSVSAFARSWS